MTHARPHLIRLSGGRTRVLRLACVGRHIYPLRYDVRPHDDMCERCGCTERFGCVGGCGWVTHAHDLCSRCLERMLT
jgi:hypothetical protein